MVFFFSWLLFFVSCGARMGISGRVRAIQAESALLGCFVLSAARAIGRCQFHSSDDSLQRVVIFWCNKPAPGFVV